MSTQKPKKSRHRRVGSGTFASAAPKYSPCRDRRYQSEPENRKVKLVDTETQTDAMEVSETDISPSAYYPSRDISTILNHCPEHNITSSSQPIDVPTSSQRKSRQFAEPQTAVSPTLQQTHYPTNNHNHLLEQRLHHQGVQYNASPMTMTPTSPNGNGSMTTSDLTFQDACSSPDQLLDDVMNSNERLDRLADCCSDNENLERLGRKVIELINENRLSMQSTTSSGTGTQSATQTTSGNNQNSTEMIIENGNSECLPKDGDVLDCSVLPPVEMRTPRLSRCSSLHRNSSTARQHVGGDASNANGESNEDFCDDSWSDEEGEDTDYNYTLRRRR